MNRVRSLTVTAMWERSARVRRIWKHTKCTRFAAIPPETPVGQQRGAGVGGGGGGEYTKP